MAGRQSMMPSRSSLTLTEELERLEQSITLTLQEIDHNFSRAHRIVTSKIIPVVESYARNSDAVWEGSKFWKEFFEASANVSLSGYEEASQQDDTADLTETAHVQDDDGQTPTQGEEDQTITQHRATAPYDDDDDSDEITIPDSPSLQINANTTPRKRPEKEAQKRHENVITREAFAEYPSPFESLKKDLEGVAPSKGKPKAANVETLGSKEQDFADTPRRPSPFMSVKKSNAGRQPSDPLLHRVLDKNYRIQATPRTAQKRKGGDSRHVGAITSKTEQRHSANFLDSSPMSSPIAAPELRAEIFGNPNLHTPRTPGLSVQKNKGRSPFDSNWKATDREEAAWDSDSDTSDSLGLSPPKTMQFHIPQSRLLQTPAREASKKIVEDILATAGGASITDEMSELEVGNRYDNDTLDIGDDSPSIVRATKDDLEGDSF